METKKLLEDFARSRNNSGKIVAAFGYGSGVFRQTGYKLQEKPMIDTIFVVENPHLWHQENMKKNPSDYPLSAKIALKYIDINAIRWSTGVTYQTVRFMDATFKYGIIGKQKFVDGLQGNWDNFFIQGRFQKPTFPIFSTEEIDSAISQNKDLALLVALLTLKKDKPTLTDLYYQICSLSYKGDIRMLFAENPNKIYNIVNGSFKELYNMYGESNNFFYTKEDGELVIDYDLLYECLLLLPDTLYDYLKKNGYSSENYKGVADALEKRMAKTNRKDSIIQPLTGVITVGPFNSLAYLGKKIKKKTMR